MTNSCPRFTRYLIQAPLRFPGWYRLSFRFPMIPSSPCSRTARLLEDCPNARSWASVAKDHSAQFVAETLGFLWVGSVAVKLGKLEKLLLLAFSASIPFSVSSLSIRWELSLRVFAMLRTCAATLTGRLMLAGTVCRPHSIGTADSPGAPDRRFASQFDASTSELQRWQCLSPARILDSAKEEFEKEAPEESMASLEVT